MSRLVSVLCLVMLVGAGPWALAKDEPEYSSKAKILLILLPYVQWSSEAKWEDGPFEIAVLGKSPFGSYLEDGVRTLTIHRRKIRIRYVSKPSDAEGCRALFICDSEKPRIDRILAWAQSRQILTMADDEVLARRGVMVNLLLEGSKVQLVVNPDAADASGLFLGSQLRTLARVITTKRSTS